MPRPRDPWRRRACGQLLRPLRQVADSGEAGTSAFTVTSGDGFRLHPYGQPVLDKWVPQGATTYTATRHLSEVPTRSCSPLRPRSSHSLRSTSTTTPSRGTRCSTVRPVARWPASARPSSRTRRRSSRTGDRQAFARPASGSRAVEAVRAFVHVRAWRRVRSPALGSRTRAGSHGPPGRAQ
jgi:hypothetical protein